MMNVIVVVLVEEEEEGKDHRNMGKAEKYRSFFVYIYNIDSIKNGLL